MHFAHAVQTASIVASMPGQDRERDAPSSVLAYVARAPHHLWAGRPTTFHWLVMFVGILIGLLFSRIFYSWS